MADASSEHERKALFPESEYLKIYLDNTDNMIKLQLIFNPGGFSAKQNSKKLLDEVVRDVQVHIKCADETLGYSSGDCYFFKKFIKAASQHMVAPLSLEPNSPPGTKKHFGIHASVEGPMSSTGCVFCQRDEQNFINQVRLANLKFQQVDEKSRIGVSCSWDNGVYSFKFNQGAAEVSVVTGNKSSEVKGPRTSFGETSHHI